MRDAHIGGVFITVAVECSNIERRRRSFEIEEGGRSPCVKEAKNSHLSIVLRTKQQHSAFVPVARRHWNFCHSTSRGLRRHASGRVVSCDGKTRQSQRDRERDGSLEPGHDSCELQVRICGRAHSGKCGLPHQLDFIELSLNPDTPVVLSAMLQYGNKGLIPYLQDTLNELLCLIDYSADEFLFSLVKVLNSLTVAVNRWFPAGKSAKKLDESGKKKEKSIPVRA